MFVQDGVVIDCVRRTPSTLPVGYRLCPWQQQTHGNCLTGTALLCRAQLRAVGQHHRPGGLGGVPLWWCRHALGSVHRCHPLPACSRPHACAAPACARWRRSRDVLENLARVLVTPNQLCRASKTPRSCNSVRHAPASCPSCVRDATILGRRRDRHTGLSACANHVTTALRLVGPSGSGVSRTPANLPRQGAAANRWPRPRVTYVSHCFCAVTPGATRTQPNTNWLSPNEMSLAWKRMPTTRPPTDPRGFSTAPRCWIMKT